MSVKIEEVMLGTDYDSFCKHGHHEKEHISFLFDPEGEVLMVDVRIKKSKFCFNCGAAVN